MKIYLHEIDANDTLLNFTEVDGWVREGVEKVDEVFEESDTKVPSRKILVEFKVRKIDEVVLLSGLINAPVAAVCSRCACSFEMLLSPRFSALFCKDPAMAGIAHLEEQGNHHKVKRVGTNHGLTRHSNPVFSSGKNSMVSADEDLDITYLLHDFIDLKDVLTEQLRLQIPYQPLCKDTCLGVCTRCGVDLNFVKCKCRVEISIRPFRVLQKEN